MVAQSALLTVYVGTKKSRLRIRVSLNTTDVGLCAPWVPAPFASVHGLLYHSYCSSETYLERVRTKVSRVWLDLERMRLRGA